jgi:hypothetical protein
MAKGNLATLPHQRNDSMEPHMSGLGESQQRFDRA